MALSKDDDKNLKRNWHKTSLSLHYMKQGLEPFADVRSKLFHEKLVTDLEQTEGQGFTTRHCFSCSSQTFTTNKQIYKDKKWSKIKCPNNICHIWLGVILSSHNYKHTPNIYWDNTDPKLWLKEPWEVAKIFQLQGCKKQKSASEADSSAILALIHNCTYIRKCLTNEGLIKEVQDVRNKIMHSSNLSLPEGDMQKYIKKMLELLQDVISSNQITPLEKDAAQDGYNKINELLKTDVDLSVDKQLEVAGVFGTHVGIIAEMTADRMKEILLNVVETHPSYLLDILEPSQRQPGGYHPPEGQQSPDWCVCGQCREMPSEAERVCCEERSCLSIQPDFQVYILDEGVLALARLYRQDVLVFDEEADIRKSNRHAAYRQFVLFTYGRLGAGNRVVIPSCCVWKIRDKYPDPFGQYTGFLPNRLV